MHPFRAAVESNDVEAVVKTLADDVEFHSPVAYTTYRGRAVVAPILFAVADVFEDFAYVASAGGPADRDHALMFRARIGPVDVEGVDVLHCDHAGLIDRLTVMVRPLRAASALVEAMRVRLAAAPREG